MQHLKLLLTLALTAFTIHLSAQALGPVTLENGQIFCGFSAFPTGNGWLQVESMIEDNPFTFQLPDILEWSFNVKKKQLEFLANADNYDTMIAISVQSVPEDAEWKDLVKANEEWFCTCGDHDCDCELIKLAHCEASFFFDKQMVQRLDEIIWDKDEVINQKTGEKTFEGPICKTSIIHYGKLLFLVMARYKGTDKERRPDLEAIHDRIANSIPQACAEQFEQLKNLK